MRVGGHFEAGVRHQEAGDVGEAGVDVFTHVLQLFVLVLRDLRHKKRNQIRTRRFGRDGSGGSGVRSLPGLTDLCCLLTHLQSLLQELHPSLLPVGKLVGKAPVSDEENQGLRKDTEPCDCRSGTC